MTTQTNRVRISAFARRCLLAALVVAVLCGLVAFDAKLPVQVVAPTAQVIR